MESFEQDRYPFDRNDNNNEADQKPEEQGHLHQIIRTFTNRIVRLENQVQKLENLVSQLLSHGSSPQTMP